MRVTITEKRSKSLKFARLARTASFLAHDVASHFSTSPSFLIASLHAAVSASISVRSGSGLASAQDVQLQVREREALQRIHLARHTGGGSVDEHAVLVEDVDDDGELAVVVTVVD